MPATTLDPNTALVVIDLQEGIRSALPDNVLRDVVARSRALVDAFHARRLPVVIVTADGLAPGRTERGRHFDAPPGFADPLEELGTQPDDIFVVKQTWGAFTRSGLEGLLRSREVTQVVIVGVATSLGVESTARQAYEAGFNVTLAMDAMADPSPEAHDHSVDFIFPRLGETASTSDIVALFGDTPSRNAA